MENDKPLSHLIQSIEDITPEGSKIKCSIIHLTDEGKRCLTFKSNPFISDNEKKDKIWKEANLFKKIVISMNMPVKMPLWAYIMALFIASFFSMIVRSITQ